jgi:hypothetical protein
VRFGKNFRRNLRDGVILSFTTAVLTLAPLMTIYQATAVEVPAEYRAQIVQMCQGLDIDQSRKDVICPAIDKLIGQASEYMSEENLRALVAEIQSNFETMMIGLVTGEIQPEDIDDRVAQNLDTIASRVREAIAGTAEEVVYDATKSPIVDNRTDHNGKQHTQAYWTVYDNTDVSTLDGLNSEQVLQALADGVKTAESLLSEGQKSADDAKTNLDNATSRLDLLSTTSGYNAAVEEAKIELGETVNELKTRLDQLNDNPAGSLAVAIEDIKTRPLEGNTKDTLKVAYADKLRTDNLSEYNAYNACGKYDIICKGLHAVGFGLYEGANTAAATAVALVSDLASAYSFSDNYLSGSLNSTLDGIVDSMINTEKATLQADENTVGSIDYRQKQIDYDLQNTAEGVVDAEITKLQGDFLTDGSVAYYNVRVAAAEAFLPGLQGAVSDAQSLLQDAINGDIDIKIAAREAAGLAAEETAEQYAVAAGKAARLAAEQAFDAVYNPIRSQVKDAVEDLVNSVVTEVEKAKTAISGAIATATAEIKAAVEQVKAEIAEVRAEIAQAIAEGREEVADLVAKLQALEAKVQGYIEQAQELAAKVKAVAGDIASGIEEVISDLRDVAGKIGEAVKFIKENTAEAIAEAQEIIQKVIDNWGGVESRIKAVVTDVEAYITSGQLKQDIDKVVDEIIALAKDGKVKADGYIATNCDSVQGYLGDIRAYLAGQTDVDLPAAIIGYINQGLDLADGYVKNICDADDDGVNIPTDLCPEVKGDLPNGCKEFIVIPPVNPPVIPPVQPPVNPPVQPLSPVNNSGTTLNVAYYYATDADAEAEEEVVTEKPVIKPSETKTTTQKDNQGEVLGEANEKQWSVANLIITIVSVIISIATLAGMSKAKKADRRLGLRIATAVLAVGAIVALLVTEDMSATAAFVDSWSVLMIVILAAQVATAVSAGKRS